MVGATYKYPTGSDRGRDDWRWLQGQVPAHNKPAESIQVGESVVEIQQWRSKSITALQGLGLRYGTAVAVSVLLY